MDVFAVVATLVCIAVVILACIKKYNVLVTLLVMGFVGFACATVVTGGSVAGDKSDGFVWFDVFEMFTSSTTSTFTAMGLVVLVVMAYSDFMGKIKASNMFAGIIAISLGKIKSKAVILVLASELALLIHWVVPSGMGCFMVCMATLFPALIACGCNPVSSAVALLIGANTASGPASSLTLLSLQTVGSAATAADAFMTYGIVMPLVVVLCGGIVNVVWSAIVEKRGGATGTTEPVNVDIKELGVPYWYGLMPVVPLVLVLVFSKMVVGSIVIGIPAAYIMCYVTFFFVHLLVVKHGERKTAFNEYGEGFWEDMGKRFGQVVSIVILGAFFGAAMTKLGGVTVIVNFLLNSLGLGYVPILFICFVLFYVMGAIGGTTMAISVIMPVVGAAAVAAGASAEALTAIAVIFTFGAGSYCLFAQPYDPKVLFISQMYGVDVMYVLKRTVIPAVAAALVTFVFGALVYGFV